MISEHQLMSVVEIKSCGIWHSRFCLPGWQ